jgi:UDP-N-acetylglucosamine 2-epimerase (non-hydrolysing)
VVVVGARPNFVKLAPLLRAAAAADRPLAWVHTGQHEAPALSRALWRDLGLPRPAASTPHVPPGPRRAATMARALEAPLARLRPAFVVVAGDVDSTVAGALAARSLALPLAHVEAGLRTWEPRLPEELNRRRVDHMATLLHTSEPLAEVHLRAEGVPAERIHAAGNVMADALLHALPRLPPREGRLARLLPGGGYGLLTLHRGANVDDPRRLARLLGAWRTLGSRLPWILPLHPRTARTLGAGLRRDLLGWGVHLVKPLAYRTFLAWLRESAVAVTDSGGLPLEASLLRVPCLTLRARYEHTLTLTEGTNRLVVPRPAQVVAAVEHALASSPPRRPRPPAWDGRAAERIVARWARHGWPGARRV